MCVAGESSIQSASSVLAEPLLQSKGPRAGVDLEATARRAALLVARAVNGRECDAAAEYAEEETCGQERCVAAWSTELAVHIDALLRIEGRGIRWSAKLRGSPCPGTVPSLSWPY